MEKMYTKEQLLAMVKKLYLDDSKFAVGIEVDGGKQMPHTAIDKFVQATGKKPSVLGVDLACYGLQLPSMRQTEFEKAVSELAEFAHEGGLVTASSHFANPTGKTGASDLCRGNLGKEDMWEQLLTEGTELNTIWKAELLIDARFLRALGDAGVPVLWRPLHECNGSWFWFCITQNDYTLPGEYMARAWRYIYNLYVNKLGLTNLLWVYAPNFTNNVNCDAMYCYPGDEYVDVIGYDWYTGGNYEVDGDGKTHDILMKPGKPVAITEFGPSGSVLADKDHDQRDEGYFNCRDLMNLVKRLNGDGRKLAYLMTWTWHWGIPTWAYGEELMNSGMALDCEELGKLFDEMK